jgi:hypothetical protein
MATLEKSELEIALERISPQYLAGLFDGEGCISCSRLHGVPGIQVNLSQAEFNILMLIGMKFGGRQPYKKYAKMAKRQGWCLAWYGRSALPFLETIQPHVILKRKLVDWAIQVAKLHHSPGGNRRFQFGLISEDNRKERERLMNLIKTENQSGKLSSTLQKDKLQ